MSTTSDDQPETQLPTSRRRIWPLIGFAAALLAIATLFVFGATMVTRGIDQAHPAAHAQPLPTKTFDLPPRQVAKLKSRPKLSTPQPGSIVRSCSPEVANAPQVQIPALCIYAPLVDTGTDSAGDLNVPVDVHDLGLDRSSAPSTGKLGSTLIAGHVDDSNQGDGAFYFLHTVQAGDDIYVTDLGGAHTHWKVFSVQTVGKAALPTDVWSTTGPKQLVLVTCGGPLLHLSSGNTYADNVIVRATPVK